jgi:hypothetical protein
LYWNEQPWKNNVFTGGQGTSTAMISHEKLNVFTGGITLVLKFAAMEN